MPCCQRRLCHECVHGYLSRTKTCPSCFYRPCMVEELQPDLPFRRAVVSFLKSHILAPKVNDLKKYVIPDGDSCIKGNEVSTVTKRKLDLLYPASSNQNMAHSVFLEGGDPSHAIDNRNKKMGLDNGYKH
ncbi:uncharacterized protein [Rutidosis leptorrhynchoides]|uniref:uncharacterized protein n=1 Tax=Rutidosis leptorrhynchoides TaxID=125765 RepID=UPI003A99A2AD